MSEFFLLIKYQFLNYILRSNKKKGLKIGGGVLTFLILLGLSIYYSFIYIDLFSSAKDSFFPYFMGYFCFLMTFMFGISNSQGMLFGFTDLDFLRSLPLKNKNIVASKIALFIGIQYMMAAVFLLPALTIFGIRAGFGALYYIFMIIGFISFPILPILLSSILGIFVKYISAGKKYANWIQNIGTILFVIVVYYISFSVGYAQGSSDGTINISRDQGIFKYLYTVNWYIDAMTKNKFIFLLLFTVVSFLFLYIAIQFYSKYIIKINEKASQGYHDDNFSLEKNKTTRSTFGALFFKEFNRVFTNFIYFINTTIGLFMLLGLSIYICFFVRDDISFLISSISFLGADIKTIIWQAVVLVIIMMGQMSCTTHVSISLEGKSVWLIKTLPIKTESVFLAKLLVNILIVIVPSFITLILIGITFKFSYIYFIVGSLFIIITAIFNSSLGLFINLLFPKLDYDREAAVIKQSLSAFMGVFVPFLLAIGLLIAFFLLIERFNLFYVYFALYLILDILLLTYLFTKGIDKFMKDIN